MPQQPQRRPVLAPQQQGGYQLPPMASLPPPPQQSGQSSLGAAAQTGGKELGDWWRNRRTQPQATPPIAEPAKHAMDWTSATGHV